MTLDTLERLVDTYLFYSYPNSVFAFQGGEPTLAGLPFFEKLVEFQQQYGRSGQSVSNALQTNAILLDKNWCQSVPSVSVAPRHVLGRTRRDSTTATVSTRRSAAPGSE